MKKKRCYAAIDIGSNAVRLLIKKVDDEEPMEVKRLTKAVMLRVPLRLGFDVFKIGKVSEEKIEKLIRLMKAYKQLLKIYEVSAYRACATSAMRDASNGAEIIRAIKKKTGISIDLIDGQEEAAIIYNNHLECTEDRKGNFVYVDVGGGSTEVNLLVDGDLKFSRSYNIGTVRMLSSGVSDGVWSSVDNDLTEQTKDLKEVNIIGSGGNINKLYRLSKNGEKQWLSVEDLSDLYEGLRSLCVEERMSRFDLKADRADVIVPAAEIFLRIASIVKAQYIHVPVIGLADGIIDSLYAQDILDMNV